MYVCLSVCLAVCLFASQTNCRTIIIHVYSNSYTFLNLTDTSYLPKMKVTVIEQHVLLVKVNIIIDVGFKILFKVLYRYPIKLCCKNCNFSVDNMQKGEKGVGLGMPHLNAIQVYCLIKHVLIQQIFISLTTANV